MTPEVVLQASGHVERFTDFMVTDALTGEPYRADHLLEAHLEAALENSKEPLSSDAKEVSSGLSSNQAQGHMLRVSCEVTRQVLDALICSSER